MTSTLDDDGELYRKFRKKRAAAKHQGIGFELTYAEWCVLVAEASIKSSDLGLNGNLYALARYGDSGPYRVGNCRFVTYSENNTEKVFTDKAREALRKEALRASRIGVKVRQEKARTRRAEYEASANTSFLNERNSQWGTFWITDGIVNKKWSCMKGEFPQGFRRGRTVAKPPPPFKGLKSTT